MSPITFTSTPIPMLAPVCLAPARAELRLQPTSAVLDCYKYRVHAAEISPVQRFPHQALTRTAFPGLPRHSKTIQYP
jgi:hypothetical protein